MATTRAQTKREWRRSLMDRADADGRSTCAYDWLRAALNDLTKERSADPSVAPSRLALRASLLTDAVACLNAKRQAMDDALTVNAKELARRHRLRRVLNAARTDEDRMRFAFDWLRSSAKCLSRKSYTLPAGEVAARADLRDRLLGETADSLARLAETAEEA